MMTINYMQAQTSFHEATIVSLSHEDSTLYLSVDDALNGDVKLSVDVTINEINCVFRNELLINRVKMEAEDGEILRLHKNDGQVLLVVQWNDFKSRSQDIVTYQNIGGKMQSRPK